MSDYISREKAYQQMLDLQTRKKERYLDIDDVRKVLHKMSPADVRENIHGKWCEYDNKYILMDEQRSYIRECMCKKCDGLAYFRISKITGKEIGNNFCPNCGADMRGET